MLEHDQSRVGTLRIAAGHRDPDARSAFAEVDAHVLATGEPGVLVQRTAGAEPEVATWPPTGHTEDTSTPYLGVAVRTTAGATLGVLSVTNDLPARSAPTRSGCWRSSRGSRPG